ASQIWDKFMNFVISRFPTQAERIFASLLEQMDPTQLDSMIEFYTQAIPQISRGDTMALQWLNTLGVLHLTRFERRGELEDLNTALLHLARVFIFSPDEYSGQLTLLNNIAAVHRAKYEHMRQNEDIDEAIGLMIKAKELAEADGERMSAVVTALESQKPDIALEWLESGRSIVWNQTLQLRTPLDHLATIDRSLAEQLKQVSQELERISSSRGVSREVDLAQATAEEAAQQHRRVAEKRDRLIEQIRNLPGNADFLQAKQASALVSASRTGAVVVIHVHSTGCHALIIRHHSTAVSILPLPKFTHKNAMDAGRRLAHSLRSYGLASRGVTKDIPKGDNVFSEILSMLWTDLAQLVLDYLGYMVRD
ncbi:hypothetical protein FRC07_010065, partial [Ceratobasidium sp. 392]